MSSYITNIIGLSNVNEHYCHFYFKVRLSGWTFPLSFSNFRHLSWSPLEWVPDLFTFSQMILKIAWSPGLCLIAVTSLAFLSSMFSCLTHVLVNVLSF